MRLIDADELLKAVDKEREYLIARGQTGAEHILVHNFRDLIDNAPTVEQEVYITGEDYNLYMRGYNQARKDFERPQGEWIRKQVSPAGCIYVCSQCGMEEVIGGNFCWNCGADMRGDKND